MNFRTHSLTCFLLCASLVSAGCGFALRGTNVTLSAPFSNSYVYSDNAAELSTEVEQLIRLNGGNIVKRDAADIIIHLGELTTSQQQLARSNDGDIREYLRSYTLTVFILDADNGALIDSRSVATTRNLQQSEQHVLASNEQAEQTRQQAVRSIADTILRYLHTIK